jgi:hypothetical protein
MWCVLTHRQRDCVCEYMMRDYPYNQDLDLWMCTWMLDHVGAPARALSAIPFEAPPDLLKPTAYIEYAGRFPYSVVLLTRFTKRSVA